MTADLAEIADQRAAFAALAGALLLSEPGPRTAPFVERVPELAALADAATGVDYERIFLRAVVPYESVFRSDEAERGGVVASRVADHLDDIGFDEHRTGRWRVAGPDHLGLELRAYAYLVGLEASAWRNGRPDEAARYVESQRRLLGDHLAWWAQVALDALVGPAGGSAYAALVDEVEQFLVEEIDRLRPVPLLDTSQLDEVPSIGRLGPRRLARHLLSPARSGMWLGLAEIGDAARNLGFPWRPMDGRQNLVPLVAAAVDAREIGQLVQPWVGLARETAARAAHRAATQPGAEVVWQSTAMRAGVTFELLERLQHEDLRADDDHELVIRVSGSGAARAVDELRAAGYDVEIVDGS